jgi:glycosyltransferase involved in cell wall biosynthesis
VASRFDDEWTNLLFVGRIIPNKRIEDLVRIFHAYRTAINPRSRLLIVGSYGGFEKYLAIVQSLAARLGTPDVYFAGHVTNEELVAFYEVADLFLCSSEHEGFCVPLIEAFHMGVPVVARAATAVPATLDGGGVLYDNTDPHHVASIIGAVLNDSELRSQVIAAQDAALARLAGKDFGATLLRFVDEIARMPRTGEPRVTFDFWEQLAAYERLEELRRFRPSIYKGLPR